ncbi:MAG TPA: prepilin-type N-terminal cleavage/methylation domain-containing protein [Vicinamibacterales bacterium]|nr:prepilin-type N-terminal cleavage/methylation domain-containing protein [Vicinamibacterales bacterium]
MNSHAMNSHAMNNAAGFSLVELIVATAIMLTVSGGAFALLGDGLGRSALWNETADLHQRARVALDVVASELSQAGAGAAGGPLGGFFPPVEPRRRGSLMSASAVTIRHVPDMAPVSTLAADLMPADPVARIAIHSGCRLGVEACGFAAGMDVVLFDGGGNWDLGTILGVAGDIVTVADVIGPRSITYGAGAQIVQIIETTLFSDAAERQLRRQQPGSAALPVVDNVIDLQLSYFGDPLPPLAPVPPLGVANCLFTSNGDRLAHPTLPADHGGLAALPLSMLQDGPFCGTGDQSYDLDLLRIRSIRATVRVQSGVAALRGQDPRLFAQPGTASVMERMIPDAILSVEMTPANLQR